MLDAIRLPDDSIKLVRSPKPAPTLAEIRAAERHSELAAALRNLERATAALHALGRAEVHDVMEAAGAIARQMG